MSEDNHIKGHEDHMVDAEVRDLLQGAVDLHVHPGPSPFPRRIGIMDAARQAQEAGFRAIVVKSHHHSMVTDILALGGVGLRDIPITVAGGVALNNQVGGLNPYAVELALRQGGRIVWFPTIASGKHICEHKTLNFPSSAISLRESSPIPIRDGEGNILPEVSDILGLIRETDAVLAGGHLDAADVDVLIRAARDAGISRVLVNHPNYVIGASPQMCAEWAEHGAYMEHSLCMYDPRSTFYHWPISVLLDYIAAVGPERTILSSDLGQQNNPLPVESYAYVVRQLLDAGVSADQVRAMVGKAAGELSGL